MQIRVWLASSHLRIYPMANDPINAATDRLEMDAVRGERVSFQAAVHYSGEADTLSVRASVQSNPPLPIRIRAVGFVPVPHHNTDVSDEDLDGVGRIPGYVPDPLFDEEEIRIGSREVGAFWFSVTVPHDHPCGHTDITVSLDPDKGEVAPLKCELLVHAPVLQERNNFPVTHWFYNDAIHDWYRFETFSEPYWEMLPAYMRNLVQHGQDTIYVPLITPPLDGVKRPTQLLHVEKNGGQKNGDVTSCGYRFDWRLVKRYIDLARRNGISRFEWSHLFTQWGCRRAPRVYTGHGGSEDMLWPPDTPGSSETYRAFLKELIPSWKLFLDEEELVDRSFFHISDEPSGESDVASYRQAREMLKDLAPWMHTMDAMSDLVFAREKLTDMPISSIQTTKAFVDEGRPCWTYFCCEPRGAYLNRLMDTPLIKIRMAGWLFYKFGVLGFLHWGYNYWYESQTRQLIDPYLESSGLAWPELPYGDTFIVYPGKRGPVDSIRWEIFAEGLQDFALLQQAGYSRDDDLLSGFEDFFRFPKSEIWWSEARKTLLARLDG